MEDQNDPVIHKKILGACMPIKNKHKKEANGRWIQTTIGEILLIRIFHVLLTLRLNLGEIFMTHGFLAGVTGDHRSEI